MISPFGGFLFLFRRAVVITELFCAVYDVYLSDSATQLACLHANYKNAGHCKYCLHVARVPNLQTVNKFLHSKAPNGPAQFPILYAFTYYGYCCESSQDQKDLEEMI